MGVFRDRPKAGSKHHYFAGVSQSVSTVLRSHSFQGRPETRSRLRRSPIVPVMNALWYPPSQRFQRPTNPRVTRWLSR